MQKEQANEGNSYKIAIFKLDTDDFEKYYNQRLIEHGCTVFPLSEFYSKNFNCKKDRIKIKQLLYLDLSRFDIIVVFDNIKIIPFLRLKMKVGAKLILWNWNKQGSMTARKEKLVSPFCEIWTFDSNDAEKYNWKLNNQFYIPVTYTNLNSTPHRKRAFCACIDKGRYPMMKKIRNYLMENNFECDFTLVKDGTSNYDPQDSEWVKEKGMPYGVFLQHTLNSDIVVDLVQAEQKGLTVRTLEALFYNKELLTNNIDIKTYFLNYIDNAFIWNDQLDSTENLISLDTTLVDNVVKEQFTYNAWIKKFVERKNNE